MFSAVKQLWSELRRRRVVKTTLAYIVGAWLLIEASSVVLPAFSLPEWSVRIVIVIAVLALPLVVILAWIFNIERNRDSLANKAANRSLESSPALTLSHYEVMIRMMSSSDDVADLRLAGLYRSGILKSN